MPHPAAKSAHADQEGCSAGSSHTAEYAFSPVLHLMFGLKIQTMIACSGNVLQPFDNVNSAATFCQYRNTMNRGEFYACRRAKKVGRKEGMKRGACDSGDGARLSASEPGDRHYGYSPPAVPVVGNDPFDEPLNAGLIVHERGAPG